MPKESTPPTPKEEAAHVEIVKLMAMNDQLKRQLRREQEKNERLEVLVLDLGQFAIDLYKPRD